jgi:hypothetical protein
MARWISSAATVESTPPDSPHTTLPDPTWARMRPTASSMNDAIVQSPVQPHTLNAKLRRIWPPCSVWATSGWNSSAYSARSRDSIAAIGVVALVAAIANPGGTATTSSPWLAQTRSSAGTPDRRGEVASTGGDTRTSA